MVLYCLHTISFISQLFRSSGNDYVHSRLRSVLCFLCIIFQLCVMNIVNIVDAVVIIIMLTINIELLLLLLLLLLLILFLTVSV